MTEFSHTREDPNIFCVVQTPDQEHFDTWGTEPPVQVFTTDFENATDTELHLYRSELLFYGSDAPSGFTYIHPPVLLTEKPVQILCRCMKNVPEPPRF